jgi:phosphoribulokinase
MTNRPIILGIVGDSAAGKTTLTRGIAQILGEEDVTVICTDDYHRYDRKQRAEMGISALHPDCNYLDIIQQHLNLLRSGQPILKPIYNHHTGSFDPPEYIKPSKFVIVEGLLGYSALGCTRLLRCQGIFGTTGISTRSVENQPRYSEAGLYRGTGSRTT